MNDLDFRRNKRPRWQVMVVGLGIAALVWGFFALSNSAWEARLTSESLDDLAKEYAQHPDDSEVSYNYAYRLSFAEKGSNSQEAYRVMAELVKRQPNSSRNWIGLARCASQAGHAREAADAYQHALALDPSQDVAHASLGQIYAEAGLTTEALQEYDHALKLNPKVDINDELLATCLLQKGRITEAWEKTIRSINANPFQDTAYIVLAKAAAKLGKWDESEALTLRRIEMSRAYPVNMFQYCMAQIELAKPRTTSTLKSSETWAYGATQPQGALRQGVKPEYCALHARILSLQHREKDARIALEEGLKLSPDDPECLQQMTELLQLQGDAKGAAQFHARYLAAIGENEEIAALRKVLDTRPSNADTSLALAAALERQRHYGQAAELCHAALASDPHRTDAAALLERCRLEALDTLAQKAAEKQANAHSP